MTLLLQNLMDALSQGSLFALSALGIGLIFSVMRLINFAQGAYISFCVFAMLLPTTQGVVQGPIGRLPTWLLIPVVVAIGALLAVASEMMVFRRLRSASAATMLVASFALGVVIQNLLLMLYSSRPVSLDLWSGLGTSVSLLGVHATLLQLVTIAVTFAILALLVLVLRFTRLGVEMRAAAEIFVMARMLGVRANRVILVAFALSGALAAIAALLILAQTGLADIRMGEPLVLIAFISAVIGGLGSLTGAVLAGFLVGAVSVLLQIVLPADIRPFREALLYAAVILCLVFRPHGLFAPRSARGRI